VALGSRDRENPARKQPGMSEWQVIGQVPIDTGRLALVDPMNADDLSEYEMGEPGSLNYEVGINDLGVGVAVYDSTGFWRRALPGRGSFRGGRGSHADRRSPGQVPPASGGRIRAARMRRACIRHGRVDCPRCGRPAWRTKPPANRYAYGAAWQRVSTSARAGRYVCQLGYPGCLGRASQVDHIVQPEAGGDDSPENLRAVCRKCHATRTGRQGAEAAKRRRNPRSGRP
jgi:5-methylcytosine-specific restriction protein A